MPRPKLKDTMSPEEYEQYIRDKRDRKNARERAARAYERKKMLREKAATADYDQLRNEAMEAARKDFEDDQLIEETDRRIKDDAHNKADIELRTGGKTADQILKEVDERVKNVRREYQQGLGFNNVYNRAVSMAEDWADNMKQPTDNPNPEQCRQKGRPKTKQEPDIVPDDKDNGNYVTGTYRRIARKLANAYSEDPVVDSPNMPEYLPPSQSQREQRFNDWLYNVRNADNVRIDASIREWMKEQGFTMHQIEMAQARGESINELITIGSRHGNTKHTYAETLDFMQAAVKTAHLLSPYDLKGKNEQKRIEEFEKMKRMQYLTYLMMPTTVLLTMLSKGVQWSCGNTKSSVELVGFSSSRLQRAASAARSGTKAFNDRLLNEVLPIITQILRNRHVPDIIIKTLSRENYLYDSTRYFLVDDQLTNLQEVKARIATTTDRVKPMPQKASAIMSQLQEQILGSSIGRAVRGYHLPEGEDHYVLKFKPIYFNTKTCQWQYDIEEMLDVLRHVHREVTSGQLEWLSEVRYAEGALYIKVDRSHTGYHAQGQYLRQSNHGDLTQQARSIALNLYMTRAYVDGSYDMPDAMVLWDVNTNNLRDFEQSQYMQLCREEMIHQQEIEAERAERQRRLALERAEKKQQQPNEQQDNAEP